MWSTRLRVDLIANLTAEERAEAQSNSGPFEMLIIPAVEYANADAYAPLYIGELRNARAADSVGYIIIAPLGAMPATSALVSSIGCDDILREGPIDGVTPHYGEPPTGDDGGQSPLSGCTASTQAAVHIAARRAMIEDLDTLVGSRYVFVRPR